jgi:hypothetical protein
MLNAAADSPDRNGFTWRLGNDRIELYGDSGRGLWNALVDFLAALGFRWPKPGQEEPPQEAAAYPLKDKQACSPPAASVRERRRFVLSGKAGTREREKIIRWAARNKYDALVWPLGDMFFWRRPRRGGGICALIMRYALVSEAGGRDLSLLMPRSLFLFHRDLFRMEEGIRVRKRHFCPTNPAAIVHIREEAAKLFSRAAPGMTAGFPPESAGPPVRVFHLWPDQGHEETWCACPACRAFSPAEQNRMAVNAAADALAGLDPQARLSCLETGDEPGGIALRDNVFSLRNAGGR